MSVRLASMLLLALALLAPSPALCAAAPDPQRRIAITLDDAPTPDGALFSGPQRTAAIIAGLRTANAPPVALFVTTRNLRGPADRQRLDDYAAAGHLLGNHSHAHPWLSRVDFDDWVADLDRARGLLARHPNTRAWYRYPFLDEGRSAGRRDAARAALAARGLANGYVTVDTYDWYLASRVERAAREGDSIDWQALRRLYLELVLAPVAFYDAIASEALGRSPAHVLLLHENDLAALYLGDLVRALAAAGWTLVDPDTAYADPIAAVEPDTLFLGQGRVAAIAHAQGRAPRTLVHASEDEAAIDRMIAERRVFGAAQPSPAAAAAPAARATTGAVPVASAR